MTYKIEEGGIYNIMKYKKGVVSGFELANCGKVYKENIKVLSKDNSNKYYKMPN